MGMYTRLQLADNSALKGSMMSCLSLPIKSLYMRQADALDIQLLSTLIYCLFFHPLSKYPGPFFAKFTDLYNVYHCLKGDRHIEFHRIHRKYGVDAFETALKFTEDL